MSSRSRQRTSPTRGIAESAQEAAPQTALLVRAGAHRQGPATGSQLPRSDPSAQDRVKELRGCAMTGLQLGGQASVPASLW